MFNRVSRLPVAGSRLTDRRGFVLVAAYLTVAVLFLLQTAYFSRIMANQQLAQRSQQTTSATHYAEAGLDYAFGQLRANSAFTGTNGTRPLGTGAYQVTVAPYPNDSSLRRITADGYYPDPATNPTAATRQREEAVVKITSDLFNFSLFGNRQVHGTNANLFVDSYDSRVGPYGGTNLDPTNGHIATNGTGTRVIDMDGGTLVMGSGNLYSGPGSNPTTAIRVPATAVYGRKLALAQRKNMPTITVPQSPYPLGDLVIASRIVLLDLNNPPFFQLPGGRYAVVVNRLLLSGTAQLQLPPNAQVDIYVLDHVDISGAVTVGDLATNDAQRLTIYNTTTRVVNIRNGATLVGAVYSPNSAIQLSGVTTIFGSLVGASILNNDGCTSVIHYDKSLAPAPGQTLSDVKLIEWNRQR